LDVLSIAENELDWPMMSSATGYMNSTFIEHPVGPVKSGYLNNWERNHCSFRDYQNIAVNGARSSNMLTTMHTMARSQTFDNPVSLSYALIGNDVCNGHYGTGSMTTPREFYQNVVATMEFLDTMLPPLSHVIFVGLANGSILYDIMGLRIHPIGAVRNDVRYCDFYDFLNCLGISPCFGWMNSDSYWREVTTNWAFSLNQVYRDIVSNNTFKNFDMHYVDTPLQQVLNIWTSKGRPEWELIELVDGFHPTQDSDALGTEVLLQEFEKLGLLPPINPNNALIEQLFGDQGGYIPDVYVHDV